MKTLRAFIVILFGSCLLANAAFAELATENINGPAARELMEAIRATGKEWTDTNKRTLRNDISFSEAGTLRLTMSIFECTDNPGLEPYALMSQMVCRDAFVNSDMKNSLALAKAISPYAVEESSAGGRSLSVSLIQCDLHYNTQENDLNRYTCAIVTNRPSGKQ